MALFSGNLFQKIGDGIKNIGSGFTGGGGLLPAITSTTTQVLNTDAAKMTIGAASGIVAAKVGASGSVDSDLVGKLAGKGTTTTNTVPWYKKLFNFYKLDTTNPEIDGQLNYDMSTGKRELNWMKIAMFAGFGFLLFWLLKPKKQKTSSRRSTRSKIKRY